MDPPPAYTDPVPPPAACTDAPAPPPTPPLAPRVCTESPPTLTSVSPLSTNSLSGTSSVASSCLSDSDGDEEPVHATRTGDPVHCDGDVEGGDGEKGEREGDKEGQGGDGHDVQGDGDDEGDGEKVGGHAQGDGQDEGDGGAPPSHTDAELLEAARRVKETVAELEEQVCRVRVTRGTRIDELDSDQFVCTGERARETRRGLVEDARRAAKLHAHEGRLPREGWAALVDETIVALCNDLLPSKAAGDFFKVSVPDFVLDMNEPPEAWHRSAPGLVVYRFWQLLVRTPEGRATLLPEGDTESYEAVQAALVDCVRDGRLGESALALVRRMPVGGPNRLTPLERQTLEGVFGAI